MIANTHSTEECSGITFNTQPGRAVLRITSDGKLEKAEGYSTEEAAQVMFDAVSDHLDGIWKKVRDENAALRADKERLDWLLKDDVMRFGFVYHDRDSIDAGRKAEQP